MAQSGVGATLTLSVSGYRVLRALALLRFNREGVPLDESVDGWVCDNIVACIRRQTTRARERGMPQIVLHLLMRDRYCDGCLTGLF